MTTNRSALSFFGGTVNFRVDYRETAPGQLLLLHPWTVAASYGSTMEDSISPIFASDGFQMRPSHFLLARRWTGINPPSKTSIPEAFYRFHPRNEVDIESTQIHWPPLTRAVFRMFPARIPDRQHRCQAAVPYAQRQSHIPANFRRNTAKVDCPSPSERNRPGRSTQP